MARNTTIQIDAGDSGELTDADSTSITFQNQGPLDIAVIGTTDATAPTSTTGAIIYKPGEGELNALLTDLFPGVASADRVHAIALRSGRGDYARVMVSHT